MPTVLATRRRLLLSTAVAVAGFAGCSGSPGSTGADDAGGAADTTTAPARPNETEDGASDSTATRVEADAPASETPDTDTPSTSADETGRMSTDEDPDLREANVVEVDFDRSGGSYRFDVTLFHDDDGEDGYANWWQVETFDGEQLGRRKLLHAHSTAPFTRSETISIPEGTTYVVVRGHDQTHGYGGQAMVVNVESGETEPVRQGSEPQDLSGYEPTV